MLGIEVPEKISDDRIGVLTAAYRMEQEFMMQLEYPPTLREISELAKEVKLFRAFKESQNSQSVK